MSGLEICDSFVMDAANFLIIKQFFGDE